MVFLWCDATLKYLRLNGSVEQTSGFSESGKASQLRREEMFVSYVDLHLSNTAIRE